MSQTFTATYKGEPMYGEKNRLERLGPQALKDVELLGEVLGSYEVADQVLADYPKESLVDMDVGALSRVDGITKHKAKTLVSIFELTRRGLHKGLGVQPTINAPGRCAALPIADIKDQDREHFVVLYLNARNQVMRKQVVAIGNFNLLLSSTPAKSSAWLLAMPANSVVLAHNHPSGDVSPSQDDINLTRRLVQAGELVGIDVMDHFIIGHDDFISLKERGLM